VGVSWDDAREYVAWLSRMTGHKYRLLTEAEWEYGARGVTSADAPHLPYPWGEKASHQHANFGTDLCCQGKVEGNDTWLNTAPVGQFPANDFGLFDMHGNVWEWVEDCYNNSYEGAPTDGSAWLTGDCNSRVVRGGAWYDEKEFYEILEWERRVNRKQIEYIQQMGSNEVLVIYRIGDRPAMRKLEEAGQQSLGRRCIIVDCQSPSDNGAVDYRKLLPDAGSNSVRNSFTSRAAMLVLPASVASI
jgi:hypothetical protein